VGLGGDVMEGLAFIESFTKVRFAGRTFRAEEH